MLGGAALRPIPMRIFQVVNVRWFNATAWYALTLSRLLVDAGHEVTVLTQANTDCERKAREMGLSPVSVDLNTTNPLRFAAAARYITQLLRTHRPEVVNCHRGEGFFLWGLLKLSGFEFKLVRTRGDQRLPRSDPFNRWLHASVADAVVVTNQRMSNHFLKAMRTPGKSVWLIHGGVDPNVFYFDQTGRDDVRKEFGFEENDVVIGLLGRFDRVKGHKELIQAVALLRRETDIPIKLFLIGFDTAMTSSQIEEWLDQYNVTDITRISGKREDVNSCISALDIGVVSSLWSEAIARAALEIMASQHPLVSSDVGVMPDLAAPELLTPAGDVQALAKAVTSVALEAETREKVLKAQKRTMSQLTHREFLKRTLSLYASLLDENQPPKS